MITDMVLLVRCGLKDINRALRVAEDRAGRYG